MTDQQSSGNSQPDPDKTKPAKTSATDPAAKLPSDSNQSPATAAESASPKKLTPEEQMALYEKELKEDDWGHQPC